MKTIMLASFIALTSACAHHHHCQKPQPCHAEKQHCNHEGCNKPHDASQPCECPECAKKPDCANCPKP